MSIKPASLIPPSPRVTVMKTETGQAIEPILDESTNLEDFHAAFLAAFGTTEQTIAEALFEQLANAIHADPAREAEFFGRDRPRVGFRDSHGEIRGLTVEEYINRLGQDLIPLAERCARVMREALAALEATRGAPSQAVERSRPARISVTFGRSDPCRLCRRVAGGHLVLQHRPPAARPGSLSQAGQG